MKQFNVEVYDKIRKPVIEVFSAIINPAKLSGYFASKADNELKQGEKVSWCFEDAGMIIDVNVINVTENENIVFEWNATGKPTGVEIILSEWKYGTNIKIIESSFEFNADDMKVAMRQTQGWTDFICSLKAYLYAGINLRNGTKTETNF